MPKKKKTRKQKELADVRRQTEPKITYTATFETKAQDRQESVSTKQKEPQQVNHAPSRHILTADYRYLRVDLLKTLILTIAIITIQLALKFGANL